MQEKLENYLDAFANGNAWWKNVSLLHFRWIGTSNLWCQFGKMTGKLFSSLFTTTFFKMQTVFPYFYRSWWPQKISLKRNMFKYIAKHYHYIVWLQILITILIIYFSTEIHFHYRWVTDILNMLQGIYIFVIFVIKRNVIIAIKVNSIY